MTCFEDLTIDLLLEIFNYLSSTDICHAFLGLNKLFDNAIQNYPACINLSKILKQPSSIHCRSLVISGLDIDIFHMKYSHFNLTSLRSLTLIKMNLHTLHLLMEKLPIQQFESITIGRLTWRYYPKDYYAEVWRIIMNIVNGNSLRYLYLPFHIRYWYTGNLSKDFPALKYATLEYISVSQMLAFLNHTPNIRRFKACLSTPHKDLFRYNILLTKLSQLVLNLQDEWSFEEVQQLLIVCPYLKKLILNLEIYEEKKSNFEPIVWQRFIEEKLSHLICLRLRFSCIVTDSNIKTNSFQEAFNQNEYWIQRKPRFQVIIKEIQQKSM